MPPVWAILIHGNVPLEDEKFGCEEFVEGGLQCYLYQPRRRVQAQAEPQAAALDTAPPSRSRFSGPAPACAGSGAGPRDRV